MTAKIYSLVRQDGIPDVRRMLREYQCELGLDMCFQGFEAELESLPGNYAPPTGCLLVAEIDGQLAGCVALRPHDEATGEMKRLYVRESFRKLGLGRKLVLHVIDQARSIGYARIRLDTLPSMHSAQLLYQSVGFVEIPPYYDNPVCGVRFLELVLTSFHSRAT